VVEEPDFFDPRILRPRDGATALGVGSGGIGHTLDGEYGDSRSPPPSIPSEPVRSIDQGMGVKGKRVGEASW
jgi:hypothetical protein